MRTTLEKGGVKCFSILSRVVKKTMAHAAVVSLAVYRHLGSDEGDFTKKRGGEHKRRMGYRGGLKLCIYFRKVTFQVHGEFHLDLSICIPVRGKTVRFGRPLREMGARGQRARGESRMWLQLGR